MSKWPGNLEFYFCIFCGLFALAIVITAQCNGRGFRPLPPKPDSKALQVKIEKYRKENAIKSRKNSQSSTPWRPVRWAWEGHSQLHRLAARVDVLSEGVERDRFWYQRTLSMLQPDEKNERVREGHRCGNADNWLRGRQSPNNLRRSSRNFGFGVVLRLVILSRV